MRTPSLSTLLIAFNVGMVVVAIVFVGTAGTSLLRRLADEQAVARVRLAGVGAVQAIERSGDRLLASAELLAERPTLARLLDECDEEGLGAYLETFRRTSQLSGYAVFVSGRLFANSKPALPWNEIVNAAHAVEGWHLLQPADTTSLLMGAWASVPTLPEATVLAVRVLDEAYAQETAEKVGLPVAITTRWDLEEHGGLAEALLFQALDGEAAPTGRIDQLKRYLSAVPLRDPGGAVVGVVEAALPTAAVDSSLRTLIGTLVLLTLGIGALATLLSLMVARRIARPIELLTAASARIGHGDLSSPVPRATGPEIGTLATTMEEMRDRILGLTTELRRKQAEAEAVLTGIVEGVFAVDRERRIRYLNPQAAALLGIRAEEAIGRFCGDVLKPQGPGGIRPCEESCPILYARFRGSARATARLLLREGEPRSIMITSAAAGSEGEDEGVAEAHQFQVIRDETEVEATRRLRDTVLANISHEFRTPLSAQLASLELLRDQLPDLKLEEVRELVLSIERGTLSLTRLIDNLLESTRIEAGRGSLRRREIALDQVVEEAVELMAPLIEQRRQTLQVDLPYPLPQVIGDATRLVQVFVNLLANANKFAPPDTTISLGGQVDDTEIRLWVEDEGPGLPSGAVDSLFQRFTRSPGEEPEASGMGLGLFIVKSIVDRHGGRVAAESSGTGTRMCVILPRSDESSARGGHENPGR